MSTLDEELQHPTDRRRVQWERFLAATSLALASVLLFYGLSSFGIWDPWELSAADSAQGTAEEAVVGSPLRQWLVAFGFDTFGISGWAGRLPVAFSGLLAIMVTASLVWRFIGLRAAAYVVLIAATSPLLLFNARQMLGDAPGILAQAAVGATAICAVYSHGNAKEGSPKAWVLWSVGVLAVVLFGIYAHGALLGVLPPLLAVAVVTWTDGSLFARHTHPNRTYAAWVVTGLALYVSFMTAGAVYADAAEYSVWTGGRPMGGDPPTFDAVLEDIFHSFAPWSALVLLAFGRMLWPLEEQSAPASETTHAAAATAPPDATDPKSDDAQDVDDDAEEVDGDASTNADVEEATGEALNHTEASGASPIELSPLAPGEQGLRLSLALWAALAYGAVTLYTSRYGDASYGAVMALAAMVGIFIREAEDNGRAWWTAGTVAFLFTALIIRDYALYPGSPVDALAISDLEVPEVFNPKRVWAALLGVFAIAAFLGIGAGSSAGEPANLKGPYRFVAAQWKRGGGFRAWLGFCFGILALSALFSLLCIIAPQALPLTSIAVRVGRYFIAAPVLIAAIIAGVQISVWAFRQLGNWRLAPLMLAGSLIGFYLVFGFQPAISAHFSPREVYDTFNEIANSDEIGEFRMSGRAAAYYAEAEPVELNTQNELITYLMAEEPRWAVIPADELPTINRIYRRRAERHLFVADARSARILLVTNQEIEGRENDNFVAQYVLDEAPDDIQHPTEIRFDDKIELLGYDLDLPSGDHVGPGQDFTITWYWRALRRVSGSWKIFLHIDGHGLRLNGDHDPVDERYPVRLWDEGDVVVDVQELTVPAHYRAGSYTIFVGFFSGENRLEVTVGPEDEDDRARPGLLEIR